MIFSIISSSSHDRDGFRLLPLPLVEPKPVVRWKQGETNKECFLKKDSRHGSQGIGLFRGHRDEEGYNTRLCLCDYRSGVVIGVFCRRYNLVVERVASLPSQTKAADGAVSLLTATNATSSPGHLRRHSCIERLLYYSNILLYAIYASLLVKTYVLFNAQLASSDAAHSNTACLFYPAVAIDQVVSPGRYLCQYHRP